MARDLFEALDAPMARDTSAVADALAGADVAGLAARAADLRDGLSGRSGGSDCFDDGRRFVIAPGVVRFTGDAERQRYIAFCDRCRHEAEVGSLIAMPLSEIRDYLRGVREKRPRSMFLRLRDDVFARLRAEGIIPRETS